MSPRPTTVLESRLPSFAFNRITSYIEGMSSGPAKGHRLPHLVDALTVGNWIFRSIQLIERNWRNEILDRVTSYDPAEEQAIVAMYREWLGPHEQCLREARGLLKAGKKVRGLREFRDNVRLAQSIIAGERPPYTDPEALARWSLAVAGARNPRPIKVDQDGRVYEDSGVRLWHPAIDPESLLRGIADDKAGRTRPFSEVMAERGL